MRKLRKIHLHQEGSHQLTVGFFVWVAINAKRKSVSCGAHAGGITGLMKTPSSNANLVDKKVFSVSRTYSGIIGLSVSPISKPA